MNLMVDIARSWPAHERRAAPKLGAPWPAGAFGPAAGRLDADLLLRVLDEVDVGLIVVAHNARALFANRAAQRACAAGTPVRLDQGLLKPRAADACAFARALQQAGEGRRAFLTCVRTDDGAPDDGGPGTRFLAFVPLDPPSRCLTDEERPAVLVAIGRQELCASLSAHFFAREQGVTLAESAVLTGLCHGRSPRHIAEDLGVAVSTVRTHITRVREKTGTRSIFDLLRVAAMLPPMRALGA